MKLSRRAGAGIAGVVAASVITVAIIAASVPKSWQSSVPWPTSAHAAITWGDQTSYSPGTEERSGTLASLTKLVTALVILDEAPLEPGQAGWLFPWSASDSASSEALQAAGAQVAPTVDGAEISERQALELALVGSAGNYADFAALRTFGSEPQFLDATRRWLESHDLQSTTVVDASGLSPMNISTGRDLVEILRLATQHPVISEIAALPATVAPDGTVVATSNPLLGLDGIDGLRTGTLDTFSIAITADAAGERATILVWNAATPTQRDLDAVRLLTWLRSPQP